MFPNIINNRIKVIPQLESFLIKSDPGNKKTGHFVGRILKNELIKTKSYKTVELRTSPTGAGEKPICDHGLTPSHYHKTQLGLIQDSLPEETTYIYDSSGKAIKKIWKVPVIEKSTKFQEMQHGWITNSTEIELNLPSHFSVDNLNLSVDREAWLKYQYLCNAILNEKNTTGMPAEQLSDFSSNVFNNSIKNSDLEELKFEDVLKNNILNDIIQISN